MISPLNSFVGLTRQAPGVAPELEALLYPTGRRNYLPASFRPTIYKARRSRCSPRDRGRNAVFVLDDRDPGYGVLMATGFATAGWGSRWR